MKIKNFSLRLFITYSSFIGFTFSELKWKRWPHLCKCIILMAIYYYAFRLLDDYQKVAEIKVKQLNQNQFGTLIDFGSEYFFIMAFFSSYLFYFIHGYSLIRLCDSKLFHQSFYNDSSSLNYHQIRLISIILLIIFNIYVFTCYASYGFWSLQLEYPFELLIKFYTMFMIIYDKTFIHIICIYFKFSTRKLLQQTNNDFKMKKTNEIHSLHTIHTLAIHCDCFHRKISYFLIVNIFRDFMYLIGSFVYIYINRFTFIQLIVLIIHFTLETYWIYLDYDMDRILSKLFIEMHRQRQQQQQCKSTKKQQQLSSFTMNLKQLMIKQSPIDNDNEIIKNW
ncbi:hypothetical protein HUG17_9648 [Dermatophagoides farinae]|uniref:Uncharacterized protein n=1 Tax=Dermatophagoides farinae TaxID=6954 RepID=A0A9D4P3I7_DERFA|nr:hypothetical protein HUG17_9648 [Dermatophagoides farinae]